MSDLEATQRVQFIDGLIGYLDVRAWALNKIQTSPAGGELLDFRMHHYLYFTNLFSAIEWVKAFLKDDAKGRSFEDHIRRSFPVPGDFNYAEELRHSIVHRGLDPVAQGKQLGRFLYAVSPPVVHSRQTKKGIKSYVCSTQLLVELAANCNQASNLAIHSVLERHGLLDPAAHLTTQDETLEAIEASSHVPDWAKTLAVEAFEKMDFEAMAKDLAQTRARKLRTLLGVSPVAIC